MPDIWTITEIESNSTNPNTYSVETECVAIGGFRQKLIRKGVYAKQQPYRYEVGDLVVIDESATIPVIIYKIETEGITKLIKG